MWGLFLAFKFGVTILGVWIGVYYVTTHAQSLPNVLLPKTYDLYELVLCLEINNVFEY